MIIDYQKKLVGEEGLLSGPKKRVLIKLVATNTVFLFCNEHLSQIAFKIFDQHNIFEVKPKFSTVLPLGQIADQTVMVTGIMVKVLMTTRILGLALGKYRR